MADVAARADFLDGCGSLPLRELREWARELTPHPAISLADCPETPMHVALLFPEVDPESDENQRPKDAR